MIVDLEIEDYTGEAREAAETLIEIMRQVERKKAGRARNMTLMMEVELDDAAVEMWRLTIERTTTAQ
jgi:hypothetical protein